MSGDQASVDTERRASEPTCYPVETEGPMELSFSSSYFLPGKLEGKVAQFPLDTGCNTNLISRKLFGRLPNSIKASLEESYPMA